MAIPLLPPCVLIKHKDNCTSYFASQLKERTWTAGVLPHKYLKLSESEGSNKKLQNLDTIKYQQGAEIE